MKRSSVVFSLTAMVAIGGCRIEDGEFGGSTPTAENVALAVPATTQGALTAGTAPRPARCSARRPTATR